MTEFEEYLKGTFEINNGIENDIDNLVRIHAPELLKLAKKELERFIASGKAITKVNSGRFQTTYIDPLKIAKHFAKWGFEAGSQCQKEQKGDDAEAFSYEKFISDVANAIPKREAGWRPSVEQLKVLNEAVLYFGDSWVSRKHQVLQSLYEDLMKV